MILTLDLTGEVPIYQQIRDQVVAAIATGTLVAGSPLPATRQLAADLGINFHTVNKAYDLLRQEGLLILNRRTGAVVHRDPGSGPPSAEFTEQWRLRLHTLLAEAVAQGLDGPAALAACATTLRDFGLAVPPVPSVLPVPPAPVAGTPVPELGDSV
ncbi:GntR family transcriptional regulator [Kitasatospora sp. NPDC008050]|uniref:GntR family transcriptional regulator n=1 Tax=Kitasatospora sp. NPDC008050 TaxID=3364021 RepID=UPI0036EEA304